MKARRNSAGFGGRNGQPVIGDIQLLRRRRAQAAKLSVLSVTAPQ